MFRDGLRAEAMARGGSEEYDGTAGTTTLMSMRPEEQTGDPVAIALDVDLAAAALALRITEEAAFAGVHFWRTSSLCFHGPSRSLKSPGITSKSLRARSDAASAFRSFPRSRSRG